MAASIVRSIRSGFRVVLYLGSSVLATGVGRSQTAPAAVPVPMTSAAVGNSYTATVSSACTTPILDTDGTSVGDGCRYDTVPLSSPQGAAVDKYGNIYIADYSHRLVRVLYEGGTQLAAAIVAANSNYTPSSHSLTAFTPTAGNVYTIAGTGVTTTALTVNSSGTYPCANNSASATAGVNALGDGCPGAGATVGPRDVSLDTDGNLFITDYTNSRIRVLCVNCSGTIAGSLIMAENAGVTPVNGEIYTVAGFNIGYRDQAPGYSSSDPSAPSNTTAVGVTTALFRSPTQAVESPSDDVFIADNLNNALRVLYNGGTAAKNILTAEGYTPTVGSVYTIAGSGCKSASNTAGGYTTANECTVTAGSDTPALGTVPGSSATSTTSGVGTGPVWAVYLDPNGNVYYTDETNARVKVIYGGVAAPLTFAGTTLHAGYAYSFAGQGSGTAGAVDGVPPSQIVFTASTGAEGVGGDTSGNIFMMDYGNGLIYETYAQTGLTAIIVGGGAQATIAKGSYCNGGSTGPTSFDAVYNGCPGTEVKLSNPRGPIVADASGTLYFGDSVGSFVRRFSYNPTFPSTAVSNTSPSQPYAFSFLSAQTLSAPVFTVSGGASAEFSDAGGDTCGAGTTVTAGASGTTCVFNVAFAPAKPGLRSGSLQLASATATLGDALFSGVGNGAGLTVDPGTATSTGTSPLVPNGVAVDGSSRVLVTDTASKSLLRYTAGVAATVASGFNAPSGVAVDGAGNIFVADSSANSVTEIPVIGGTKFTLSTAVSNPRGLAVDGLGDLYVADTGNNHVLMYAPGASLPVVLGFTGLSAPQAVAVDASGNVYAADSTHIVKLSSVGMQSAVGSGSAFTGLAVDAGGNVLATTSTALREYPASGGAAVTLSGGFTSTSSLALDASGNAYVADGGANSFVTLQRTAGYYKFTSSPGSTTLTLTNSGNASLTTPSYTQTDSTDFSLAGATTNGCSGAIAVGTECGLSASFAPTVAGTLTDSVTVGSNAANASPVTITLTGTTAAQTTTTALSLSPSSLVYGNVETLTATVTGSLQTPSNGTVSFYNNGSTTAFASANVTSGQAVYSFVPPVGSYSITAAYVPSGLTYTGSVTTSAKTFTVTAATLTVTANNASKTYGSANPAFTYSITGFVNNDTQSGAVTGTPNETTTATTNSSVGTYPITITQGTLAAANYNFMFVNGTLTVSGATPQSITFGALPNVTYGVTPITLTATASSQLVVSYTVTGPATVSGSTLTVTGAGNISVTANQTGNNTYAAAPNVTQSFTSSPAMLTVTAGSPSKVYGSADPTLTYTITGFVNNDVQATATTGAPNESTTVTASSGVGSYAVTITQGTLAAANYTFGFTNGSLTVTPAQLTLTANSVSRAYGTANPTFAGTLSGTVNNDSLTETFTTAATISSPVGSYAIVPGVAGTNAGNYTTAGTVTNGTLTITQVKPGLGLVASPTVGYNGTTTITLTATFTTSYGTPTGMVTFLLSGASIGTGTIANGVATLSLTTLPVGTDAVSASYVGDTNFTLATSDTATVSIAAGFGVSSSATTFTFQSNYQEAQGFLTINPGGRTDTLSFACAGLPAKLSCAFNPNTLALSGLTTAQTVQVLISNSNATASLRSEPGIMRTATRATALAALPLGALLLLGLRRRRSLPMLLLLCFLSLGAAFGLSGCGTSANDLKQPSGTYNFTINVNSGSTTLQSISCTLNVP